MNIIEMAQECQLIGMRPHLDGIYQEALEKFAELVAAAARADEREKCSRTRAGKPRILPSIGTGALWSEQFYCFTKGWNEGAASVRKAIRARGTT